ncbi:MAG: Sir2 family NAD+-dependent deacetylase [Stellaceae bacterium]
MRGIGNLWPEAPNIVILTGAGISQESGLATFRDAGGIWTSVRLEEVATPEAFVRDPARVHAFYNARRRQLQHPSVTPNAAHEALARLEALRPGEVVIATQNIDDLHERAGSRTIIHMHGELLKARCTACGKVTSWYDDLTGNEMCQACAIEGQLRPHVVWFGEMPLRLDAIYQALAECKIFVSIGTSGGVEPAASFVEEARRAGAHTVELNLQPSHSADLFVERIYGPASQIVPEFVAKLISR